MDTPLGLPAPPRRDAPQPSGASAMRSGIGDSPGAGRPRALCVRPAAGM